MKLKQNFIPLGENDPLHINHLYSHYSPKHYTKSFDLYPRPLKTERKADEEQNRYGKGIREIKNPFQFKKTHIKRVQSKQLNDKWEKCLKQPLKHISTKAALKIIEQTNFSTKKMLKWIMRDKQYKITPKLFILRRNQLYIALNFSNAYPLQKSSLNTLTLLPQQTMNKDLLQIVGSFLVYRQDILLSSTIITITAAFYEYIPHTPLIIFQLLCYICTSQVYYPFLTNDHGQRSYIVNKICDEIQRNCVGATFLKKKKIRLGYYIQYWVRSFWMTIDQKAGVLRQKLLLYLLVNKFSISSIQRVCEATIIGLNGILNKSKKQKLQYVLMNPKQYLDEQLFIKYLFIN